MLGITIRCFNTIIRNISMSQHKFEASNAHLSLDNLVGKEVSLAGENFVSVAPILFSERPVPLPVLPGPLVDAAVLPSAAG